MLMFVFHLQGMASYYCYYCSIVTLALNMKYRQLESLE